MSQIDHVAGDGGAGTGSAKDEGLRLVQEQYENMRDAVDGLDDAQMSKVWFGEWGVRDIIAHITGWEREMAVMFQRMARGERPTQEGADYSDADAWNAKFAGSLKAQNVNTIVADWHQTHGNFVRAAKSVPDDRFGEKDGKATTASRLLAGGGHEHYKEHAGQIREWRKQEGI